jgi:hypothetical protein
MSIGKQVKVEKFGKLILPYTLQYRSCLFRYHVHEKLANFMAPNPIADRENAWHDEMVDELFRSLPKIYAQG